MIKRIILLSVAVVVFLVGCSSDSYADKPNEIRSEIWNVSGDIFYELVEKTENRQSASPSKLNSFNDIYDKYTNDEKLDNLSVEEFNLIADIKELILASDGVVMASNPLNLELRKEYYNNFKEIKGRLDSYFPSRN